MWQWPETKQLHETREDALADMKERIRILRGESPAE